jgi:hypothetical protein
VLLKQGLESRNPKRERELLGVAKARPWALSYFLENG